MPDPDKSLIKEFKKNHADENDFFYKLFNDTFVEDIADFADGTKQTIDGTIQTVTDPVGTAKKSLGMDETSGMNPWLAGGIGGVVGMIAKWASGLFFGDGIMGTIGKWIVGIGTSLLVYNMLKEKPKSDFNKASDNPNQTPDAKADHKNGVSKEFDEKVSKTKSYAQALDTRLTSVGVNPHETPGAKADATIPKGKSKISQDLIDATHNRLKNAKNEEKLDVKVEQPHLEID